MTSNLSGSAINAQGLTSVKIDFSLIEDGSRLTNHQETAKKLQARTQELKVAGNPQLFTFRLYACQWFQNFLIQHWIFEFESSLTLPLSSSHTHKRWNFSKSKSESLMKVTYLHFTELKFAKFRRRRVQEIFQVPIVPPSLSKFFKYEGEPTPFLFTFSLFNLPLSLSLSLSLSFFQVPRLGRIPERKLYYVLSLSLTHTRFFSFSVYLSLHYLHFYFSMPHDQDGLRKNSRPSPGNRNMFHVYR